MTKIVLFIVLSLPGQPPQKAHHDMPSLEECLASVGEVMNADHGNIFEGGGMLQAGCVVMHNATGPRA